MTTEDLRRELRLFVQARGTYRRAAKALGISVPYLHDVVNGNRGISDRIARELGFQRETRFVPYDDAADLADTIPLP